MSRTSLWSDTTQLAKYAALDKTTKASIAIVGGGIAGLTAALKLQLSGKDVVVLEARRIGAGETGQTTAHLTEVLDERYFALESNFGREGARLAAESSRTAIAAIEQIARECAPNALFKRVPAYLYAETDEQADELHRELESLARVGAEAAWVDDLPLPFPTRGGIRVAQQAQFQPLEYLKGLALQFVRAGGRIYEEAEVLSVNDGDPCRVMISGERVVVAKTVFVLTNVPITNRLTLHTTNAAYRSYVIGARLDVDFPDGLFFDANEPYHYTRRQHSERGSFVLIGGEDHKTGQSGDTEHAFEALEEYAATRFGLKNIEYRWSGQIIVPTDGLPFVGKNPGEQHVYVATGFSGTGLTFGTLAGMVLSDLVSGVANPLVELFSPNRPMPISQTKKLIAQNVDFPSELVRDRFSRGDVDTLADVPAGQGRLMRSGGKMLAVFRSAAGDVTACSAVCPHLGCYVQWNNAEHSWDCPCHGSRFTPEGGVMNGPAHRALERIPVNDEP